jgi:hypothetical protein
MLRPVTSTLAASVLLASLAACSANGQSGCTQPPLQQYPAPSLINPASGATKVPDNIGVIQVSTQTSVIVGVLTLASSGGTVNVESATLDPKQPNPNAYLWDVKVPALKAATTYTLTWTVTYPGACLGPTVVQTHSIASFTTQ